MTAAQRLREVINYLRMNPNRFAESIGMKRSEGLYKVLRGKTNITPSLAGKITNKYTNIHYEWLLSEKGEMLNSKYDTPPDYNHLIVEDNPDVRHLLKEIEELKKERDWLRNQLELCIKNK